MNKEQQIAEMAKIVDEMYNVYTTTAEDIAEGLYNAGYRKIMNGKELNSEPDEEECDVIDDYTIGFATYLMQKRRDEVDELNKIYGDGFIKY